MKKKDLDTLKKMLTDEKAKIMRHLESLSDSQEEELDISTGDPVDIASQEINQNSIQKIGKRETFLLKKIDLALKKIDENTYGECEECGEEISVQRLMARPVAQFCIDCKTEQESVERRFSTRDAVEEEDEYSETEEEL